MFSPSGPIPSLTIAGRTFTDLTNLVVLFARTSPAGRFSGFFDATTNLNYQVPAGKTLYIEAIQVSSNAAADNPPILGYSDSAVAVTAAAAGANPVEVFQGFLSGATTKQEFNTKHRTPATKYPYAVMGTAVDTVIYAFGYVS